MNKEEFDNKQKYFDDDLLSNINESLAKQVSEEMETDKSDDTESDLGDGKKKMPKWLRILLIVGSILLVVGIGGALTINAILDRVRINGFDGERMDEYFDEDDIDGEEMDPNSVEWMDPNILRSDADVINILLVGEEAIDSGGSRGRTDSIMIATINVKQKAYKLTSLMRDMYVQIPGYSDNKLNAAYHNGGIPLLVETIKKNFGVELDGSVLVNFDGFEKLIDRLGGVEITLTAAEASYLNRTNYISKKRYRNVKEGTQILNGNQALGYSRVRYVRSIDSGSDDFGRTGRQRKVLNAVFDKYKTKNAAELVLLLNDILPYIQTDIEKTDIISYIYTMVTLGAAEMQTLRLPVDNGYKPANIRKMSVLLPDLPTNIRELHEFIFGDVGDISHLFDSSINSNTTYNNTNNNNSYSKPAVNNGNRTGNTGSKSNQSSTSTTQSTNNSNSGGTKKPTTPANPVNQIPENQVPDPDTDGESVNTETPGTDGEVPDTNVPDGAPEDTETSGSGSGTSTNETPEKGNSSTETSGNNTETPPDTETPVTDPPSTEQPNSEVINPPNTSNPNTESKGTDTSSSTDAAIADPAGINLNDINQ